MKKLPSLLLVILLALMIYACSNAKKEESKMFASADSVATSNEFLSSSAAQETNKDSSRKFIRTAEMKFKVKNVFDATYKIEDLTKNFGGFVTYTNLSSRVSHHTTVAISADSSLESTYYEVENVMTLRVPNVKLDSTLRAIARHIEFLDSRSITADDVALQLYSNKLAQKRIGRHEKRLQEAIDNRGKKLLETTNAEEDLYNKQEQADGAALSTLSLNDQINYSTIKLIFYQRETVKRELIANDKNITAYQTGFVAKLWEALKEGWDMLSVFFIFMARLWGFILLAMLFFVLIKRYGHLLDKK